ncbi:MAG: hypothetical protein IKF78_15880 [Atopobiaceae bacterium]|nr:hypothetical protein [Atopobiaceae bacterium]
MGDAHGARTRSHGLGGVFGAAAVDWKSTYVGVFPGRPGSLLRVNVRLKSERIDAMCAEVLERLRVKGASEALSPYEDALARSSGFDCQLDRITVTYRIVDEANTLAGSV